MAVLSVRDFPDNVMQTLKMQALANRQTLKEYVTQQLTSIANGKKSQKL